MAGAKVAKRHWNAPDGHTYRLVDATADFIVHVEPADRIGAIQKNIWECVLAHALRRTTHATIAMVGADKTYVPMKINGEWVAMRFKNPAATRRAHDHYDNTGEMPDEGFLFCAIPPSQTLDSQRSQQKRTRERWGTIGNPKAKPRKRRYLRTASRAVQVKVDS